MDRVIFNLPFHQKKRFAELSERRGLTMSTYLRMLVTDELKKFEEARR